MNVERFERDTTSVWTFRFPCRVGFAFGIFAASALASAGEGLSITLAASGSRNSIFATAQDLTQAQPDSFLLRACGDSRRRNSAGAAVHSVLRAQEGQDGQDAAMVIGRRHQTELHEDVLDVGLDRLRAQEQAPQMPRFERPSAIRASTSRSRGVSPTPA